MKKWKAHLGYQVLLLMLLAPTPSLATVTISVTNDAVLSGETGAITCIITADNSETLITYQWKYPSDNVIGSAPGSFTSNGVSYTITNLGLTGDQILNSKLEASSVSSDLTPLTCFALISGGGVQQDTGIIDVVSITPTRNAIVTGGSSAVSCTLAGVSDGANPTVEWSQSGSPINTDGTHSLSSDYSGSNKVATLTLSSVSSDQTYTCKFTASAGGSVTSTVDLDHVTITTNGDVVNSGGTAEINCVLSGASQAPLSKKWIDGTSTDITANDGNPYIFYENPTNTFILQINPITQSTTFTCCYEFATGSCINTPAQVDVITITASNYLVATGNNLDISCVLSNSPNAPNSVTWKTSAGTIDTGVTPGTFSSNSQTTTLSITGIAEDTVYTCEFAIPIGGSTATASKSISVDTVTLTPTAGTAQSGGQVTVSCQIVGAGVQPTVMWKDGGSTVDTGVNNDPWAPSTGTLLSKLTVSGLTSSKTYTCEFTVNGEMISQTATANILSIAAVGATTDTGSAATVTCTISNSPAAPSSVFWKDSTQNTVTMSGGFSKSENSFSGGSQEAKLVLGTSSISADTVYTCVFVVDGASYETTTSVDHITITAGDTSKLSAGAATVSCVLAGANSAPTVEWLDSSNVPKTSSDSGYTVTPGSLTSGGLTTSLTSSSDTTDTTYTCKFTFANGVVEKVTTMDVVTVTGTNDAVKSGGTATVTCSLAGSQFAPSQNAWYLSDVEKPTGGDYVASLGSYDSGADTQVMTLQKSSVSSTDTYRCSFTINGARIDGSAKITSLTITATDYAVKVNDGIAISCAIANAESDPTIVWKTNAGTIDTGIVNGNFVSSGGTKTSTLTLTQVSSDTTYTCEFTMGPDTVSSTIDVDTVTITTTEGTALSGDTVTVTCQISGAGTQPTVTWEDGGSAVDTGINNDPWVSNTGTLISKLTVSGLTSNKDYTCKFNVDGSTVSSTVTANLLTITAVGTTVYTGSTSTITCTISNAQEDPSLISWKNGGGNNLVSGNNGYTITNGAFSSGSKETKLTLNTNEISEDKTYTCVYVVASASLQKVVSIDHVTITPSSFAKLSGATATVSCVLAGAGSTPTVEWLDSSNAVKTSSDGGYTVTPGSFTSGGLTTSLVSSSDTTDTTYTCKFTFTDAVLTKVLTVDVVAITPGNDIVKSGDTATLSCTLTGTQFPTTQAAWTLGNTPITTGGDYNVNVGAYNNVAGNHIMTLERSNAVSDETYTCTFTASGVTVANSASTTVFGVTSASDTIKAGETATLTCGISGLDAEPTVAWLDNAGGTISSGGANTITPGSWNGGTGSISTELTVTGLTADASYSCKFTLSDGSTTSETVRVFFVSVDVTSSTETVASGSSATLTCTLSGSSTAPSGPVWNDGTSNLSDGGGITIIPGSFSAGTQTSTLTVSSVTWDTTYSCSFTISSTTVTETKAVDVVVVAVPGVTIAQGEVATLTCTVSDIGAAVTIAWNGYSSGITPGIFGGSTQDSVLEVSYVGSDTTITCAVTRDSFSTTSSGVVTVLDPCAKGSYFLTSGGTTTCTKCPLNTYTDNPNLRSCTPCPNSGNTLFTGSSSVNQCLTKSPDHSVVMKTGSSVTLTAAITVSDTVASAAWTSSLGGSLSDTESSSGKTFTSTLVVSSWAAQTFTCTFSVTRTGESSPATTAVTITGLAAAIIDQPAATAQSPGASYTISCTADLPPSGLDFKSGWLKDGEQVDIIMTTADQTLSDKVKSTLTIGYLTSDMTGNYACFFTYALTADLPTSTYRVTSDTTHLAVEGISLFPAQSGGLSGSSATITCLGVSSADADSVEWKINGSPVIFSTTNTVTNTFTTVSSSKESKSVLVLGSISSADEGSIECLMLFDVGWYSSTGVMNVISIVASPEDVDGFTGAPAEMHCLVEGPPSPTIEWYKGTTKVDDSLSAISTEGSNQYNSILTIASCSESDQGQYKCKATWATDLGVTGGTTESETADLAVYGISYLTANQEIAQNSNLKLQCRVDDLDTTAIIWKKDGVTVSGDGIQRSDLGTWSDTISADTSKIGTVQYSCQAKYTHTSGDISYSGTQTTTLTVYKTCSALSNPTGGTVVCSGSDSDKTCSVTCNTGYVPRANPRTFTCTDGTWDQEPSNTDCTAKATPSSYRLTYTAVYNYPIPCGTSWGPYILAAFPYHMNNAEGSLTNVPAVVQMDANSFECVNTPTTCTSSSNCQQIKIKFQYVQTSSLSNDDPLQTTRTEIGSYVSSTSLDVLGLLNTAGRLDSHGNLQGSYGGKKKRSTEEKYSGPGFVMEPAEGEVESSVQCPEFSIMVDNHCTMCGQGWFIKERDCAPCPLGTYQAEEDSNKCSPCPEGLSTLVTAATSPLMCVEVCQVRQPLHGTVHPPEGSLLTSPSDVTVLCDEGFTLETGERYGEASCEEEVHCSRINLLGVPEFIIRDTELTIDCVIEAEFEFENCTLIQDGAVVQKSSTFKDNNRQICSFDVFLTSSTELSCSAEGPDLLLKGDTKEITLLRPTAKANLEVFMVSDSMNLACSAIVPPGHSVLMRWKKHGEVIGSPSFSQTTLGLLIHSKNRVQFEDSGEYSCEVEYLGIGVSESESIPVRVVGFLEELSDFSLYKGHSVKISCVLPTGNSISMLEWYRDGERQNDQGSRIDGDDIRVITSELTVAYPGTYECKGDTSGVPFSSVAVVDLSENYGFVVHPESQYIVEGGYAVFSCRFSQDDITVEWLLDGSPMGEGQNNQRSLRLASITKDKQVQCVAKPPTGEKIFSKSAKVIVRRFITEPSDTVLGDEHATFHCSVYGPLIQDIVWETDYGVLQPTSTSQLTAVELHATLKISSSNKVRCAVTFEDGDRLVSKWVNTLTYEVTVSEGFVLLNEGFIARCRIHSDEAPTAVFWKMRSDVLYEDSDVIYDGYQGYSESTYYLTSLTDAQVAELTCMAAFRGTTITVTSPQRSLTPLGIISDPRDVSLVLGTVNEFEIWCDFYDYTEVETTVTWSLDGIEKLEKTTIYIRDNIARSTIRGRVTEDGYFDVKCSVDYSNYGIVDSNSALVSVLEPISVTAVSSEVGYGEIAEVEARIPHISGSDPSYHWSVNGVYVNEQEHLHDTFYLKSVLRWPIMQDSTVTLTVFSNGELSRDSVEIKVYGIQSVSVEGAVELGSTADLVCIVDMRTPPEEVFWYFNTIKHPSTSSLHLDTSSKSILTLPEINPSSFGHYTCVARYSNRPSVFQRLSLVPVGACTLPHILNGGFSSSFISEGSTATVTCSPSFVPVNQQNSLRCRNGVLEGRTPVCVQVLETIDDTSASLMVVLATCACVLMTCSVVVSFVFWYKKHNKVGLLFFLIFFLIIAFYK